MVQASDGSAVRVGVHEEHNLATIIDSPSAPKQIQLLM